MNKWMVLALVVLLAGGPLVAQSGIELDKVRFFNAGDSAPDQASRVYATSFAQGEARYVWCELQVKNLLYNVRNQSHQVVWVYYNSDNSVRGKVNSDFNIKSEWESSHISHGWGWDDAGNWPVGNYRVELLVGNVKFAEGFFAIVAAQPKSKNLVFKSVQLFESSKDVKPDEATEFKTSFPKSSTRYVAFLMTADNLLHQIRTHQPLVEGRYYKPDGSFWGSADINIDVLSEWDEVRFWSGWGWNDAGNWTPGEYRVDLYIEKDKVASQKFSVYDDKLVSVPKIPAIPKIPEIPKIEPVKTLEYEFLKLFESSEDVNPDEDTEYATTFPRSTTRYVGFVLGAKNLLHGVESHYPKIEGWYYKPDGSFWGSADINIEVPPDWDECDFWSGWGWAQPGNWTPGTYKLEVYVDKVKVAEQNFTITAQ